MRYVLTALLLASLITRPGPAQASCDPHASDAPGNWFAYALRTGYSNIDGVRASLLEYRPFIPWEPFATRATSAWVMLSRTGYPQFAQVGWLEWRGGVRNVFVQDWNGSGYPRFDFSKNPDWTYGEYQVLYTGTQFVFYNRGSRLHTATAALNPDKGEMATETHNQLNQMPGDYGARSFMAFNAMNKRVGGLWSAYSANIIGTSDNSKWYASNARGGMDPYRQLVTADRRGDCA